MKQKKVFSIISLLILIGGALVIAEEDSYPEQEQFQGKLFGIFSVTPTYTAEVNDKTGDINLWEGPWWEFLVLSKEKKPASIEELEEKRKTSKTLPEKQNEVHTEVVNFETCEAKTGISTDSNPRECTYQEKTYLEGVNGYIHETTGERIGETKTYYENYGPAIIFLPGETKKYGTYTYGIESIGTNTVSIKIESDYQGVPLIRTGELRVGDTYSKYDDEISFIVDEIHYESTFKAAAIRLIIHDYTSCKIAGYDTYRDSNAIDYCTANEQTYTQNLFAGDIRMLRPTPAPEITSVDQVL